MPQNCSLLSMEQHGFLSQRSLCLNWGTGECFLSPVSQHKVWPCPDCKLRSDLPLLPFTCPGFHQKETEARGQGEAPVLSRRLDHLNKSRETAPVSLTVQYNCLVWAKTSTQIALGCALGTYMCTLTSLFPLL